MRCEKIQDLLLTDHLDGRLSRAEQEKITTHLRECATCREFAETASIALAPLATAEQLPPPASVWQMVRQQIAAEPRPAASPFGAFLGKLFPLAVIRQPALVAAGLVAVALLTAVLLRHPFPGSGPSVVARENRIDYVAALVGADDDDEEEREGLDTDIENYFL